MSVSSEVLQLQEEVSRLNRRVEHLELELTKLVGHKVNKPTLSFLQLPREVRDLIYLYALKCTPHAELSPRNHHYFAPPTPAICLVNRQISAEANEILYSRNTIYFDDPDEMHQSLETIGTINKAHIRSLAIWFDFRTIEQRRRDKWWTTGTASHWVTALFRIGLTKLTKIAVSTECCGATSYSLYYPSMDPAMERVIKYLFQGNQEGTTRHLMLTGFNYDDRQRFPGNWRVTMTQFDPDWIDDPDYAGLMPIPPPEYLEHEPTDERRPATSAI